MKNKRFVAVSVLLLVSIIWGLAGPVIKNTLDSFPPLLFLSYRFAISAVIGLIYFSLRPHHIPKTYVQVHHTVFQGLFTVVFGLTLLFFGFNYTTSLTGSLIAAMGPLFMIATGHFMLHEKVTRGELLGLGLAITGSLLTIATPNGSWNIGLLGLSLLGNILILLSRVADAIGGVYIKYSLKAKVNAHALSHASFITGFFVLFILTIITYDPQTMVNTLLSAPLEAHIGVWYMAVLSGTIAYSLSDYALQYMELGEVSMFSYLTPLFALPASIFWLHETISPQFVLGLIIITFGVCIAEWKKRRRIKLAS